MGVPHWVKVSHYLGFLHSGSLKAGKRGGLSGQRRGADRLLRLAGYGLRALGALGVLLKGSSKP